VITPDVPDIESVHTAINTGPYGRCVYECDNDVVDNQLVTMQFEHGQSAMLNMIAFSEKQCKRYTKIYGTRGELTSEDGIVRPLISLFRCSIVLLELI
jgi:predicted dehydrogenase